ncbi:MAG: hypothetical protein K1X71_11200 [Pirellulales bacterium]|nr:hypothetical protein [Pirellulales bacterium]
MRYSHKRGLAALAASLALFFGAAQCRAQQAEVELEPPLPVERQASDATDAAPVPMAIQRTRRTSATPSPLAERLMLARQSREATANASEAAVLVEPAPLDGEAAPADLVESLVQTAPAPAQPICDVPADVAPPQPEVVGSPRSLRIAGATPVVSQSKAQGRRMRRDADVRLAAANESPAPLPPHSIAPVQTAEHMQAIAETVISDVVVSPPGETQDSGAVATDDVAAGDCASGNCSGGQCGSDCAKPALGSRLGCLGCLGGLLVQHEVGSFNCGCNGSYKFPVPPLYTYHWPGMYSQELMTDYHYPWRFLPLKPYTDEFPRPGEPGKLAGAAPAISMTPPATSVRVVSATVESAPAVATPMAIEAPRMPGEPEPTSKKLERLYGVK